MTSRGENAVDDGLTNVRETAGRASHETPTSWPLAVAYTVSLLALIAVATALIVSGRY
ncbi:hypothetical protein ACIQF6_00745 [Kitasatospora sp. NPDC092948]|uniref:hypothetical protein n=1 Tax=Kitasatospora sp. NPDC092948 TaxID=3364088 RepID=UPI0037FE4E0F